MKYLFIIVLIFSIGCKKSGSNKKANEINEALTTELAKMVVVDQLAAWNAQPPEDFEYLSQEEWEAKKDSIYRNHKERLEEILNQYGYPGFDLVGQEGERDFWLMTQHADFDPEFQKRVLVQLKTEVDRGNANGANFGLLTDRVNLNLGNQQVYGTQVTFLEATGQAIPKPLVDSLQVNLRRASVGLEPIEEYLNDMTQLHFDMNKEYLISKGITEPIFYDTQ